MDLDDLYLDFVNDVRVRPWDWICIENLRDPDRRLSGHVVGIDFSRFVKLSNIPNDPSNYRSYVKLSDVPNDYDVRYWRVVEIAFHPPFSPVFSSLSTGNPETLPP